MTKCSLLFAVNVCTNSSQNEISHLLAGEVSVSQILKHSNCYDMTYKPTNLTTMLHEISKF